MLNVLEEFIYRGLDWCVDVVIGLEVSMVFYIFFFVGKYNIFFK